MTAFIDELSDLFPDHVTVRTMSAPDEYGARTLISSVSLPARVLGRIIIAKDQAGEEHVSSVQAIFPGVYGLTTDMEYILPVRFVPRDPMALSVGHATDEDGPSHERVLFYWKQSGK